MTNVAGKRYGVHPTTRTERYKGQSQVRAASRAGFTRTTQHLLTHAQTLKCPAAARPPLTRSNARVHIQVSLSDADPESRKPWRTTNQVFQACAQEQGAVGLANAGIASDVASRLHKTQVGAQTLAPLPGMLGSGLRVRRRCPATTAQGLTWEVP